MITLVDEAEIFWRILAGMDNDLGERYAAPEQPDDDRGPYDVDPRSGRVASRYPGFRLAFEEPSGAGWWPRVETDDRGPRTNTYFGPQERRDGQED